jgi:hypothetical protein
MSGKEMEEIAPQELWQQFIEQFRKAAGQRALEGMGTKSDRKRDAKFINRLLKAYKREFGVPYDRAGAEVE